MENYEILETSYKIVLILNDNIISNNVQEMHTCSPISLLLRKYTINTPSRHGHHDIALISYIRFYVNKCRSVWWSWLHMFNTVKCFNNICIDMSIYLYINISIAIWWHISWWHKLKQSCFNRRRQIINLNDILYICSDYDQCLYQPPRSIMLLV